MNLCKSMASRIPKDVIITVIVTQEWLGYIVSYPKPRNIHVAAIPNLMPTDEKDEQHGIPGFVEALETKMRPSIEQLLDQLESPVTAIVGDIGVIRPADVARNRNIRVALFWTMSAYCFELHRQLDILAPARHRRLSICSSFG